MMHRRLLPLLILLLASSPVFAQKLTGTLKGIADSGVLRIGYRTDVPPFSFVDQNGGPAGYSVDMCNRIAAAIREQLKLTDLDIKYHVVDLDTRFTTVEKDEVDIVCAATTITLSRQEKVDFTLMTFLTGGSILSRRARPVETTGDLSGKSVAVIRAASTAVALGTYLSESLIDARVVTVETLDIGMEMLSKGEVDAVAGDQIGLIGKLMQHRDPQSFTMSQDMYSYEPYGLIVKRGDPDFRLAANRALARLYRTGQYKALYNKWFGRSGVRPSPILAAMFQLQALPE
jgi:ABC-type amino acid transport substrate-binding protein